MFLRSLTLWVVVSAGLFAFQADESARHMESGKRLLQQQNWKAAAGEFEQALKSAPKNVDAHIGLGVARWAAGDHAGALATFRQAVELNPSSAEAHYNVALALRDTNEMKKAITEMNIALKLRPAYEEARLALGLMLQQTGDVAAAIAQYQQALRRNPRSAEAHNWLGVAYMQKNQLADAATEFRAAIQQKPDFARAYNNLGSTLAQAGDLQEGISAFESGLKHAPDDLQLHLNLGTALRTKGDPEGAIVHFQIVLKRDPDNPEVHHQLGMALREKGDTEGAIREFETALALNPEYREGYYVLGQVLRQRAAALRPAQQSSAKAQEDLKRGGEALVKPDFPAAIEAFRKAVAADPQSVESHYKLAAALWYGGDQAKSASELDIVLQLNPSLGEASSLRGIAYREAKDHSAAQRMLQRAVALNPRLQIAYFDLGVLYLRMNRLSHALGQFEAGLNLPATQRAPDLEVAIRELRSAIAGKQQAEAHIVLGRLLGLAGVNSKEVIAELETAIRLKPGSAEAHNSLGLVYTQLNDDAHAIAAFRTAIRLRPDYADAHANAGALLTALDAAESVKELEKAIELQPGLLKAQYNLAIAYGSSPKHGIDKEIAQLRKLLGLDNEYPRANFALGRALLRKGSVPDAITQLERATQLEPEFGEAHYQLGLALARAGRAQESASHLQKGRELIAAAQRDQTAVLDMSEGEEAFEKGELDQALAKFRQVLKERPDLAEAHYRLGLTLARKGDSAAAADAYRKTLELNSRHMGAKQELDKLGAVKSDDPSQVASFEGYIREGRFRELEPLLQAYVKQRPESSWGWYALGYTYFAQQKIGDSINALAKSLSLNVTNAEAHKVLGRNLMIIGRFDAAQREFELGEKYDPRSAEMPFNLGRLFSIQDQWTPAKSAFERALRIDPSYMEALDGLGFALEALGEEMPAIAKYQEAAKINEQRKGSFATPYINLSAYHNRTGNPDAALEFARKAVAVNERADRAWFQMARAMERRGELDAAVDAVQRAISFNARSSSYYYVLSTLYRRLGKQKESSEALEVFSKLDRESNALEEKRRESLRND